MITTYPHSSLPINRSMNRIHSSIRRWLLDVWDHVALWLLRLWDRASDSLPWRSRPVVCRPFKSSGKSHRLGVRPYRAIITGSCTASVLRSLHLYFSGQYLGQSQAIELMRCWPGGAPLNRIALVLRRRLRCRSYRLRTAHQIRRSLRSGAPVIASDDVSYRPDGHAILITGVTPRGFWSIDPGTGKHRWRTSRRLIRASDEFIAVHPRV